MKNLRFAFRWDKFWLRYVLGFPELLTDAVLCALPTKRKMGFRVIASNDASVGDFPDAVGAALALLEKFDPVRFNRVRSEVGTILNGPAALNYGRAARLCALDVRLFESKGDPEKTAAMIASAIVFNATEGYLLSRGITHTRRNWSRVQRLKWREARRFLKRVGISSSLWDVVDQQAFEFVPLRQRLPLFTQAGQGWLGRSVRPPVQK